MKKLLSILLCFTLSLAVCAFFVGCDDKSGDSTEKELGFTYDLVTDDDTSYLKVTGYNVSDEVNELVSRQNFADEAVVAVSKLEIPTEEVEYKRNGEVVGSYPVKEIAESAFSGMLFIKEIVIPANVETIGSACLAGCTNLEKLTVPFVGNKQEGNLNSAKTLGYLFGTTEVTGATSTSIKYNASGSVTVYVPNSLKQVVLTGGTKVGEYAFYGLSNVEEIVLPDAVTEYGTYAFSGCTSLYKFTIGSQVTTIGEYAFNGCTSLVNPGLNEAEALTTIGDYAFNGCSLLLYSVNESVYKPSDKIVYIGTDAFASCSSIDEVDLSLLSGKTVEIKQGAFKNCTAVESVVLPADDANVTYGNLVFTGCPVTQGNVQNYKELYLFDFDYDN